MTDLSPEAQTLLRQAREAFSPSENRVQAVRSALRAEIAVSPHAPISSASSSGGLGAPLLGAAGWSTGHAVIAAVAIGVISAGALALWRSSSPRSSAVAARTELLVHPQPAVAIAAEQAEEQGEPSTPPSPDPSPAAEEPVGFTMPSHAYPAAPLAVPRDRTNERAAPLAARGAARARSKSEAPRESLAASATTAALTDSLAEEVHMLRQARSALDRGEAAQALRLLDAHAARFQHGTLREERLATRVQALCALGLVDSARTAAQELERVAPRSPHLARVRASCISGPPNR